VPERRHGTSLSRAMSLTPAEEKVVDLVASREQELVELLRS
jgi:hypothetical protein